MRAQPRPHIGIGDMTFFVDGKRIFMHGKAKSSRHIQLSGEGPENQGRPNVLNTAVAVLQTRVHEL